jgi:uncharacterized protein (TIGR00369 family)
MSDPVLPDPARDGWRQRTGGSFFGVVGPLWARREDASWAYGFLAEERHTNPAGVVHGGMLTTLIDHALSTIAWEGAERRACMTVALDTHFLAAVRPGQFVEARGRIVRQTQSLSFLQGALSVAGEEVLTASAVMRIMRG